MIDITAIIVAIIGVLATVITTVAVPWLKAKLGAERWKQLGQIAKVAVEAAEQLHKAGLIDIPKLEYATDRVNEALARANVSYDCDIVRAAIEAQVLAMNAG